MLVLPLILCIETSGNVCSVALCKGDTLLGTETDLSGEHAKYLSVLIDRLLDCQKIKYSDLGAVAVSKGPGSYTGLRIGTATAKGICYGTGKPLIAVGSLESLARLCPTDQKEALYCPMIDARRAEVYTAVFNAQTEEIMPVEAKIIDEDSFRDILDKQKMVFFGSGAEKCKQFIKHPNAQFANIESSAAGLAKPAYDAFLSKKFEDTAYFEPFYLKDYVVLQSKKQLLK